MLPVNWSMTDPIYSVLRWLIFFCCIWHTCNCFSFFIEYNVCIYVTFRIHHKLFNSRKVSYHETFRVTSKQDRHFIVLFRTVISFNRLNVNMFFLFVCLSDCKYLLFPCVSDTLAGNFLSAQLIYRGKVELCYPLYNFRGNNWNYFSRTLPTAKIKIRKK